MLLSMKLSKYTGEPIYCGDNFSTMIEGVMAIIEAKVILAKCSEHNKTFGIRVEKQNNDWVMTWAFEIDDAQAKREGFDRTVITGSFDAVSGYPGCPYCKAETVFICYCKKISCCTDSKKSTMCYWCNNNINHLRHISSIKIKSGDY